MAPKRKSSSSDTSSNSTEDQRNKACSSSSDTSESKYKKIKREGITFLQNDFLEILLNIFSNNKLDDQQFETQVLSSKSVTSKISIDNLRALCTSLGQLENQSFNFKTMSKKEDYLRKLFSQREEVVKGMRILHSRIRSENVIVDWEWECMIPLDYSNLNNMTQDYLNNNVLTRYSQTLKSATPSFDNSIIFQKPSPVHLASSQPILSHLNGDSTSEANGAMDVSATISVGCEVPIVEPTNNAEQLAPNLQSPFTNYTTTPPPIQNDNMEFYLQEMRESKAKIMMLKNKYREAKKEIEMWKQKFEQAEQYIKELLGLYNAFQKGFNKIVDRKVETTEEKVTFMGRTAIFDMDFRSVLANAKQIGVVCNMLASKFGIEDYLTNSQFKTEVKHLIRTYCKQVVIKSTRQFDNMKRTWKNKVDKPTPSGTNNHHQVCATTDGSSNGSSNNSGITIGNGCDDDDIEWESSSSVI